MKIACPVLAAVFIALSVVGVQQARRVWWEPSAVLGRRPPRSAAAGAGLMIGFTVILVGGSVAFDVPGTAAQQAGAGLVAAGFAGIVLAMIGMETTRRFGRPAFLVPPGLRPGTAEPGAAGPDEAESGAAGPDEAEPPAWAEPARAERAPTGPLPADPLPAEPDADEFIVIVGRGSHLAGSVDEAGRLVLTTRRLALRERGRPGGGDAEWPVAGFSEVAAGPGDTGLTLQCADGRAEVFTVNRERDLWVATVRKLLSLPAPVVSWYGDPPDDGRPVTVPDGAAVVVLSRVEGEVRDRGLGYRVLLDRHRAGKIRRGERIELPVTPGRHVLALRTTWVGSRAIAFDAAVGQVVRFCCEPGGFPGMTQADMEADQTGYIRLRRL